MTDAVIPVFHDAPRFGAGAVFSLETVRSEHSDDWFNQSLVTVNDSNVRFAKIHGEFHHHHHDTDELFFVLNGEMEIDVGNQTHRLKSGEGILIEAGTVHRTRAESPAQLLVIAAREATMNGVAD